MTTRSGKDDKTPVVMEMYDFIYSFLNPYHLTKADIDGESGALEVYLFDRNFEEAGNIWDGSRKTFSGKKETTRGIPMKPSELFSETVAKVSRPERSNDYFGAKQVVESGEWDITYSYGETVLHDIEGLFTREKGGSCWRSIRSCSKEETDLLKIAENTPSSTVLSKLESFKVKHQKEWEEYPDEGKVGWRGPMVPKKVLDDLEREGKLPLVYWIKCAVEGIGDEAWNSMKPVVTSL